MVVKLAPQTVHASTRVAPWTMALPLLIDSCAMTFSLFMSLSKGTRLTVAGELDVNTVERLEPALRMVVRRPPVHIEVDLSRLRMIDSAGVGQLVGFCKRLRAVGCWPVIVGLRDQPLAVFRLLRLDRMLADPEIEAPAD